MKNVEMAWVVMDEEGRVTLPPALRRRCGLRPGANLLILQNADLGSTLLHGVGLILLSPVALGRKLSRTEEALHRVDGAGSGPPAFAAPPE